MPMLSLRDSRLTDIDGDLSAILRMHKFRKRTTRIHVHFQRIRELVLRQIGQIQAEKFLCKRFIRHLRHYKCLRLCLNCSNRSTISPSVTLCVTGTQQYCPCASKTVSTPSNVQFLMGSDPNDPSYIVL